MKKSVLLAVLGLAVGTAASHGQGTMHFDSYNANGGYGLITTFAVGGAPVASGYTAALIYSLSSVSDAAGTSPLNGAFTVSSDTSPFLTGGAAGYFTGTDFSLSPYTAGATVYFEVVAYQTAAGSYANSTIRGHSAVFSTTLATGIIPAAYPSFTPFTVAAVPEPTTLALAGLGGLASLVAFRRKQA